MVSNFPICHSGYGGACPIPEPHQGPTFEVLNGHKNLEMEVARSYIL